MAIKIESTPTIFKPTLDATGYAAGDTLFNVEVINALNKHGNIISTLVQLGIFWDIADAPEIILYFFHSNDGNWGDVGDLPAPTFDQRTDLIGVWEVDEDSQQGYETMKGDNGLDNSYALYTGDLAHFIAKDSVGYIVGVCKTAITTDLTDKLAITLLVRK